jgi:aspartyl-tRNA synthetase
MYSSKIKSIINKAKSKGMGAIPVGLRVAFGGVKIFVEAQFRIDNKIVINLIGDSKNTVASIDGSVSNKTSAKNMLYNYVVNNTKEKKFQKSIYYGYRRPDLKVDLPHEKAMKMLKSDTSKFVDELYKEVVAANKINLKKSDPSPRKKVVAKKPVSAKKAKTPTKKKTVSTKKINSSARSSYKYIYDKKKGNIVYAGIIKK